MLEYKLESAAMRLTVLAAGLGTRLREQSGGKSKLFLEVGGATLIDRLLALARFLDVTPLIVTRSRFAADFRATGAEVLVEEKPSSPLDTLYHARDCLRDPFCWVGGDTLFSDAVPLRGLVADHLANRGLCSFLYCRTSRFKAKLALEPAPRMKVTHDGGFLYSMPLFGVHSPAFLDELAEQPRVTSMERAVNRGEQVCFRRYDAPVFEIDTPQDLAEARRHFAGGLEG
jgi:choline kinase